MKLTEPPLATVSMISALSAASVGSSALKGRMTGSGMA